MHCLSLIYCVSQPLHVLGIFAHRQEVFTVYVEQLVHVTHLDTVNKYLLMMGKYA
jgi:hypothetical protein